MPTWMLILMRETRTLAGIKGLWDGGWVRNKQRWRGLRARTPESKMIG
jgi:hypothetical protein